ncbi:phage tail spike protein [Bacillus cereus]|nr:phage tail spike protein [Bacillus cereus]EOP10458.1 phage minor structural protein [Bacillus cereus MC118]
MRKPSGELHIIDSKTQQVIASLKPSEYVTDLRHWELQNNIDTLDIDILENSKFAPYLQQQNIIVKETRPGVLTPYVITEIEKDSTARTISVFASGEWTLMGGDDFIKPQTFNAWTPEQYIDFACKNTDYTRGIVEVAGKRTMTAKEFVSPLGLLSQLPGLFEKKGELRYRVELRGANTIKRKVDFIERRGTDKGKEITVGKDLNGITRTENSEAIITALIPYVVGEDADGNEKITTIETVNGGSPYIVDEDAFQRWNRNGKHRFGFYTPETDNKDMTPARLLQLAKTELKKRVDTIVSYEVDAFDLSRIPGFEHELVYEGDTLRIKDISLTPPLYLEARVIAGDESHKDNRATKYKFGNYREIVDPNAELRRLYQKILSSLGDKVPKDLFDELSNRVDNTELTSEEALKRAEQAEKEAKASQDITNKVIEDLKNYQTTIIEQPTVPTSPPHKLEVNKTLWLDSSNPAKKILKIYRGNNTWERIVPDTSQAEKDLAKLIQDVGTVQGEVNQLKKDALKTQEDIKNIGVEVNKKVDRTWLDEEMKKKANADSVYTRDYVDKNLVGKQIYEVDKQANIKGFQDMNTKYDQTAEAIKLTATKDELKQTNQNVTSVTKTVNDVKITADENSKKITKVEGDFKNMQIGSVNLALDSEFICDVKNATANYSSLKSLKTSTKVNYRNKKLTMSYILTGNITGKGTSPWTGAELVVRYADSTVEYLSMRRDNLPVGTTWLEDKHSQTFTIKDKDVTGLQVTAGSRDVFGNINIKYLQVEEGTVATAWKPAIEEAVSTGDFTKVTNEIKQTVDTNSQTITKVEQKVTTVDGKVDATNKNLTDTNKNLADTNKNLADTTKKANDTSNQVTTLTKTTNEIKQGVEENSQTITKVEKRVDDFKVGAENLFLASESPTVIPPKNANAPADNYNYASIPAEMQMDREYTISARVKFTTAPPFVSTKITVYPFTDGVSTAVDIKDGYIFHTFKKTNANTKAILLYAGIAGATRGIGAEFTEIMVTEGNVPVSYAPSKASSSEFTKTTNEIKQTVDTNSQTITRVEKKVNDQDASIADVTKKTNEIKQTVDKNSQTITTLSTTQGEHGKLIQSNKSSIEQLNNEIKLTVSETQMEDYIGSLGTTNLFLNTPFEMKEIDKDGNVTKRTPSLDKWNFTNNTKPGVTVEASVSRHHAGYNSMHIKSTGQTSNIYVNAFQDAPMLSNSGAYVLSFWMYTEDVKAIDEGATVGMYIYGGGSQVGKKEVALKPLLKSGAWVFIVLNVDALTVPTTHARMYLTLVKNGSIYLSQPQYQQGTKPSTYMPNPKDITNYKEMIDLVGSKVATSDYNKQVTKYDTQFEQNTREINLRATKESVYTKTEGDNKYGEKAMVVRHEADIKLNAQEINLRVKAGDIASSINQTAQAVLIQASKINLKGAVTADSIQSGRLDGVIITTKNTAVNPYWVHMQGQNITLKETKLVNNVPTDISRGYWGFMPNLGRSKNVIRTALVLGNNYDNANNVAVEGSLFIEHQTPDWNGYNASSIRIGRARSRNSDSSINTSAEILFDNDGSLDITAREGGINLISKGTTVINTSRIGTTQNSHLYMTADGDVSLDARTGRWQFNNGKSSSAYNSRTLQIDDKRVSGGDQADVDFGLGQYVMLRVPHHPSYTQYGLEIKNSDGTALQNIHVDTVYLRANNWTSAREKKTGIKDIEVDSLATMMALAPKQYYFKEDIEKLYDMRQAVIDGGYIEPTPTLNDIPLEYGFIADEIPDCLASTDRKTISSYRLTTIGIAGTQEVYKKHLALEETVKEQATQLAMQEDRIARLEELLLQQLINKKPEQP